jgi:hypothetical protein
MRTLPFYLLAAGGLGVALASCGGGRDVFPDAESLEKAGKLEEAAARFDLVCPFAPGGARCGEADARASEARTKAAEAAIAEGRFLDADRLLRQAMLTADEARRKRAGERLLAADLVQGLAVDRALAMADRRKAAAVLEPIAAGGAPGAAKAKAWLDKEGPALLAQAVRAACGPDHEGSCTETFARLQATAAKGPEIDEAARAAEAEQRRVYPLRNQAEGFVRVFAALGKKRKTAGECLVEHTRDGTDPGVARAKCDEEVFGADPDDKRYQAEKNNENLFRRLLKQIADPALARDLEARKALTLTQGEAPSITIPKPAPRSP